MRIMRGYSFLKKAKSLRLIPEMNQALTSQRLNINEDHFSKLIFGSGIDQAEIICRQYLLVQLAGLKLNRAMLHAVGRKGSPLIYYLPPQWRETISKAGVRIPRLLAAIIWQAFVGMMLAYGVFKIGKIAFEGIRATYKRTPRLSGNYVYFNDLNVKHLPKPCRDGKSHDIFTWYMRWAGRVPDIDRLFYGTAGNEHGAVDGIPIVPMKSPLPPLTGFGDIFRFIVWGIAATALAARDFLLGRWWHALLLNQAASAAQVRLQRSARLAGEYLFNNSGWIYRFLWTYEAEKLGSRITFYFYSTNCEAFKRPEGYPPVPYGWSAMNWPRYLVWDEYLADFVRRAVGDRGEIDVVGHIQFVCSSEEMPEVGINSVAVFDVTPFRSSRYRTIGASFEYFVPDTCIAFLKDLQEITHDSGYSMVWKRKRKIGSMAHPQYLFYEEKLSGAENVIIVDPDISAERVIEHCAAVISMPFTSTALIARSLGKPSCYYDPTGMVQRDDRAAHGIEIVIGPDELSEWLKNIKSSNGITNR